MLDLKKNAAAWVPVRLLDNAGAPVVGAAFGVITASVSRENNTESVLSIGAGDWFEAVTGPLAGSGTYQLKLPASATTVEGALVYGVDGPLSKFVGMVNVVAFLEPAPTPYVSFTATGDTVAPIILQVTSPKHTQVRITYSEAVVMTTAANGALNLSNYSIPGLTITAAVATTAQQVLLTTSAQTPNLLYTLMVINVEDLQGNPIA